MKLYVTLYTFVFMGRCHGNKLEGYPWKKIVDDKMANVPDKCLEYLIKCYDKTASKEILIEDSDRRLKLCRLLRRDFSWANCIRLKQGCSWNERQVVTRDFMCYRFNVSDEGVPPVSSDCAIKYLYCSGLQRSPFTDRIAQGIGLGKNHTTEQEHNIMHDICVSGDLPYLEDTQMVKSPYHGDYIEFIRLRCYDEITGGLFRKLLEFKQFSEQQYMCGKLKECLTHADLLLSDDERVEVRCTGKDAELAEDAMCSNTTFTPEPYGTFLLSERCKESFFDCYNVTLASLADDKMVRRSLCESRYKYGNCSESSRCDHPAEIVIISNYLCYDQNNTMLYLSNLCRLGLSDGIDMFDVSYLEMTEYVEEKGLRSKGDWCNYTSKLNASLSDDTNVSPSCSERELDHIQTYLGCTSSAKAVAISAILTFLSAQAIKHMFV